MPLLVPRPTYVTLADLGASDPLQAFLKPTTTASGTPTTMPPAMDNDLLAQATMEAESISKLVSPWLWVLSIAGFGMALLNTSRISKMWQRYSGSKFKGLQKPR